jgi:hypothetical protein
MTTDKHPVLRLEESEDLLRTARRAAAGGSEAELLALLVSKVDEAVVRDLAVLSDAVNLNRWLPRDVVRASIPAAHVVHRDSVRPSACCWPLRRH